MRPARVLLLAISIIGIYSIMTNITHAQTKPVIVFGPKQYVKPKGRPITYTDTFKAISTSGVHTIWVQNGKNGLNEVKHLSITLNGAEVITSKDLRVHNPATKPMTVQPNNTLIVTLNGKEGNFVTVKILCEGCVPEVHIVSPQDGNTVNASSTLLKGTINTNSREVGITVNGILAEVSGDTFVANGVPLNIGENTITAVAIDGSGNTSRDTITVHTNEYQNMVNLTSDKTRGLSPMTVRFSLDTRIKNQIVTYEIDFEGDGVIDQTIGDLDTISFTYTQVGISYPTITVTDDQDNRYADTIAINVVSTDKMDTILKAKWEGMKEGLQSGEITTALKYFAEGSQVRYQGIFTALQGNLAEIAANMQEIKLIYIKDGIAKYRIRRQEEAGEITYYIYFQLDKNGLWKIRQF